MNQAPYFSSSKTLLAVAIFSLMTASHADETAEQQNSTNVLPTISIQAQKESSSAYVATKATSALKSDAPLFKTAQSVSVVTREQLDQKQARTLADALEGVAGVEAGKLGRRGWDDFVIRGQTSSDSVYIDGLRVGQNTYVATELSGMDQVQVLKGPASINFGLVAPGGMVNLVTKRPEAENFARASMTYGSYNLKEGIFDLNYSPNNSEKGAFRLNGRISDQDDPTDYVYFKNYYISPSYNFDLGDNTDLSVITSYQHREYIRQQGLPVIGTLKDNPNGAIDRSLYIGDPNFGKYEADVYRTGYTFKHAFNNGWNFNQNFAVQKTEMDGTAVFAQTKKFWTDSSYTTINRANNSRHQVIDNLSFAIDNRLNKQFDLYGMQHDINIGVDAFQEKSDYTNDKYDIGNLNIYDPVYGQNVTLKQNVRDINRLKYLGLYLRDRIQFNDQWLLSLSGRQDWAQTQSTSLVTSSASKQSDNAFTGSASVMYTLNDIVAPYVSYATSFTPNSGTDVNNNPFKPEEGKQVEVGMKLQSSDQRVQGAIAWYDLKRQNVLVTDTANSGYKAQRGEQLTRGIETELSAEILEGLKLTAAYTYTIDAEISKDANSSNVGKALDNIPEHAYSLSARYKLDPASKLGWYVGGGFRGETYKTVDGLDVHIPGYTVFDTEAGYDAGHWGAQLAIRNLFDKDYYAGALNENLVTLGNPRQINFTVKFNY
ncbi:TonB-dependent siderophore receptor [Acinetobacter oleivorans]|uniref:TonB-dependent siderophore receptor n=1 Tax=Acinetobacter oleivorans TaxID=1148157 RepID=A0ABR9NJ28_9GAMM|nr:TonB-dependent siderophore receptor [Acinetobacter oleivorans]MBE2164458.1 TonB-dependent siderophore receptor [Acinetobacter oleivorans]